MPFVGKDWRSPGDAWMRSDQGWQLARSWRRQFLENLTNRIHLRIMMSCPNLGVDPRSLNWPPREDSDIHLHQPYIVLPRRITQERKALVCASQAFTALDFESAIKDQKKFKYVCKVLECLFNEKFAEMSGTTHNLVVKLLEIACQTVLKKETNIREVDKLLRCYIESGGSALSKIGSDTRHQSNVKTVQNLRDDIHSFTPTQKFQDGQVTLTDLPEEMVRGILRRLTDHADLLHTGGTRSDLYSMVQEELLWKDLCHFHFSENQRRHLLAREDVCLDDQNWKTRYKKLVKRYGTRDVFATTLHLCSYCNALYWPSHGHPCAHIITEEEKAEPLKAPVPVAPRMFIDFFYPKPHQTWHW